MSLPNHDIWPNKDESSPYHKKTAYFSMELGIDQALKTYSGGLGYLAGSHLRSAHDLKMNIVGISLLWTKGYYTQERSPNGEMKVSFIDHAYTFLHDIQTTFTVVVSGHNVLIKAYLLSPETFGTAPVFFLTTDIPENDPISRTITHRLYDSNKATRIAQSIVLGIGGAKLLEILGEKVDVYHMNEGHALPLAFYLYAKSHLVEEVRKQLVFTTHTPEMAGNEETDLNLLYNMSFFYGLAMEEVKAISNISGNTLNYTLTALRLSRKANGVSKMHGEVAKKMWEGNENICPIISITNAQNKKYWADPLLEKAHQSNNPAALARKKKELKQELFKQVADQTGKILDPEVLTIVWARRFAGYKRANLILRDFDRFKQLVIRTDNPIQMIWAGKPYPEDYQATDLFNNLIKSTAGLARCAVLVGYELELSVMLKKGADVWLNTPRITREASGTSGMTAAMNGALNFSAQDGWIPEFSRHGENGFYLPATSSELPHEEQDSLDHFNLMRMLEEEVIPTYYQHSGKWIGMVQNSMKDVYPAFDSDRMVKEYYEKMYT